MADSVISGDAGGAASLARRSLDFGIPPLQSIDNGFVRGIRVVGDRFGAGEMFLPELVMSAEAMKAALAILEPELAKGTGARESQGEVLACTVQGDIHDIDRFVEEIKQRRPDIVAMSALLTTTAPNQKKVISRMIEEGIRDDYIVMIGGAPTSRAWAAQIGADGHGENASEAVRVAIDLMARKRAGTLRDAGHGEKSRNDAPAGDTPTPAPDDGVAAAGPRQP
jgi:methanogenic corrinoid protein MtbC1